MTDHTTPRRTPAAASALRAASASSDGSRCSVVGTAGAFGVSVASDVTGVSAPLRVRSALGA